METDIDKLVYEVQELRHLTESTYVLRFSRNGMQFSPGQHISLGLPGNEELREYSIYSGIQDESLEVLIKEVDEGLVSRQLKNIKPGDPIKLMGPRGFFLNQAEMLEGTKLLFISSGTGLAPFHSFVKSYPNADYKIIHGVRNISEAYDYKDYEEDRFTVCTSRGNKGDYPGRITDYLLHSNPDPESLVFLCGNSNMIYDAMDILRTKGFSHKQIITEVYF